MNSPNMQLGSTTGEKTLEVIAIAMEAIPYVGGVMSSISSRFLEMRKNQRLNDFLIALAEDLQSTKGLINREFAASQEFRDLTETVLSHAAETIQQEKLDALRAIFVNTTLSVYSCYDETLEIIELVDSWQPRHIILLKILDDPLAADEQMGNVVGRGGRGTTTSIGKILSRLLPEWNEDQIDRTWQDLYDKKIHQTPEIRTKMTDRGIHQIQGLLTNFGRLVAAYIKNQAGESSSRREVAQGDAQGAPGCR